MPTRHVVVDGSNLATEGRTTPSLAQLEEVVADLRREMDGAQVTVVVDASFRHRIDASERDRHAQNVGSAPVTQCCLRYSIISRVSLRLFSAATCPYQKLRKGQKRLEFLNSPP